MRISLAISTLLLSGSFAISFPNDMFYHHHPDVAEEHAKSLYKTNHRYTQPQGDEKSNGQSPPRQRYPYRANYNGNGISKRGIKYTEDGAIDWSSMAENGNPKNLYTDQEASEGNYRGVEQDEQPQESDDYEPEPRQFYDGDNQQDSRQPYRDNYQQDSRHNYGDNYQQGPHQSYDDDKQDPRQLYDDDPYRDDNNNQGSRYADPYNRASDNEYYPDNYGNKKKFRDEYQNPPAPSKEIKHAAAADNIGEDYTSGQGTFYDLETHIGICGKQRKNTEFIAALNSEQMGSANRNNPNCGKHVEIIGPNGKSVEVEIVDDCKTCESGDLDLSPAGKSIFP
ncbi:unnamed protein product [Rhizopus stolonifer]